MPCVQPLFYLDNCVFSEMLKHEEIIDLLSLPSLNLRLAFSDMHLTEMYDMREQYVPLLEKLDPVFIRNPSEEQGHLHWLASLDPVEAETRFSDKEEWRETDEAFEAMLLPLHHLMGGHKDRTIEEIADEARAGIEDSLKSLLAPYHTELGEKPLARLLERLDAPDEQLRRMTPKDDWENIQLQVHRVRHGDPMRDMTPLDKVDHLFKQMSDDERAEVEQIYPKNFARKKRVEVGGLSSFALLLFSMGLTKRKQIFSGKHQDRRFRAQLRDTQHIEMASFCDFFLTSDKGAFDLARACYAYSGFTTLPILMETEGKKVKFR